ncbi:MAG: radical SAM protein [Chloroflexi bacterium]|nr:radical SAM protein [Chloroflexota bacterium]
MKLNVARFIERTASEGPGWRASIWVQGCPILCIGCCNPHMLPFVDRQWIDAEEVAARVLEIKDIEGVTFVGGEPFAQAQAVAQVAKIVRTANLSVVVFSGYTYQQLTSNDDPAWADLLAQIDLLLAGPYLQDLYTTQRPWVGSSNQTYHFLTARYQHFTEQLALPNTVELRLTPDGHLELNGFAFAGMLPALRKALNDRGVRVQTVKSGDETVLDSDH